MLDSYQDLIEELLGTPKVIRRVADAGVDPGALLPLVAELRDRDQVVMERVQRMTRQPFPHLKALPDRAAAAAPVVAEQDPAEVLASFETARGDLVALLMNLTLKDWEKRATHDTLGEVTLADEVEAHVEFDEEHLERIEQIAAGR